MKHHAQHNSRLGRVLVNKGQLTEQQLDQALKLQAETGERLGEILVSNGWISHAQLQRALKRQSLIRKVGTIATVIAAPMQAVTGLAATTIAKPVAPLNRAGIAEQLTEIPGASLQQAIDLPNGMVALSDDEMSDAAAQGPGSYNALPFLNVGAQGVSAGYQQSYDDQDDEDKAAEQAGYQVIDAVTTVMGFGPISSGIEADVTVKGFQRFDNDPSLSILDNGAVRISTAFRADQISYENIRVTGSDDGSSFGSVYLTDIEFAPGSNITIQPNNSRF